LRIRCVGKPPWITLWRLENELTRSAPCDELVTGLIPGRYLVRSYRSESTVEVKANETSEVTVEEVPTTELTLDVRRRGAPIVGRSAIGCQTTAGQGFMWTGSIWYLSPDRTERIPRESTVITCVDDDDPTQRGSATLDNPGPTATLSVDLQ
jgi:hypothetical protein